jgi:type IV pilus assembly protein PilB
MFWRIGEILIQKKLISWEQLSEVLDEQKKSKEFTGEILIRKGFISANLLYKALADQYDMKFVDLKRTRVNPRAIELIPRSICEKYTIIPLEAVKDTLIVGIGTPLHVWPEMEVRQLTKMQAITTVLCLPAQIRQAIEEYYPVADKPRRDVPAEPETPRYEGKANSKAV